GWLTDISNVENLGNDLFAFKIDYDKIFGASKSQATSYPHLYNGNIRQSVWRTAPDNQIRSYRYLSDKLNRLLHAHYNKINYTPGAIQIYVATPTNSYNESLAYDTNGNILQLSRTGALDSSVFTIEIDDLVFIYDDGNKLKKV